MTATDSDETRPIIVVVGSINMDLVARVDRLPSPGETVTGTSFHTIPGGKGANQAVAAARLGARVILIARLGSDSFGNTLRQGLIADGVDTTHVFQTEVCSSGVALIAVESSGANAITVIPGANGQLSVQDIQACEAIIASANALVVQLETPVSTVVAAIAAARRHRVLTILDPAPVPSGQIPAELFMVDILSPNQTEAELLTGSRVSDWTSAESAARELQCRGANDIVLKMGSMGALACHRDGSFYRVAAVDVDAVDTTAAGDAFTAALTVATCEGKLLEQATRYACMAGSLACTRLGAQPAMPTRDELDRWAKVGDR